ncbi:MAG TPA: insulinase family protein, partial [Methylomirabilota bacterium]
MRSARRLAAGVLALVVLAPAVGGPQTTGVTRTRLPNGMMLLVRENPSAPVVAASLIIRMGTRWETYQTAGLSNFLQLMVVRGTTTMNGTQIVETADRMGGTIEAYGEADNAEIAATAL